MRVSASGSYNTVKQGTVISLLADCRTFLFKVVTVWSNLGMVIPVLPWQRVHLGAIRYVLMVLCTNGFIPGSCSVLECLTEQHFQVLFLS